MSEEHVRLVIEVTARLHNFCTDRNVSQDIDDYIVHDAKYWAAVKPDAVKHARLRDLAVSAEPVLLQTCERAQFLPVGFSSGPQERCKRKSACDYIASQGLLRPTAASLPKPLRRESANLPHTIPENNRWE